jgi:hypothetical protein
MVGDKKKRGRERTGKKRKQYCCKLHPQLQDFRKISQQYGNILHFTDIVGYFLA